MHTKMNFLCQQLDHHRQTHIILHKIRLRTYYRAAFAGVKRNIHLHTSELIQGFVVSQAICAVPRCIGCNRTVHNTHRHTYTLLCRRWVTNRHRHFIAVDQLAHKAPWQPAVGRKFMSLTSDRKSIGCEQYSATGSRSITGRAADNRSVKCDVTSGGCIVGLSITWPRHMAVVTHDGAISTPSPCCIIYSKRPPAVDQTLACLTVRRWARSIIMPCLQCLLMPSVRRRISDGLNQTYVANYCRTRKPQAFSFVCSSSDCFHGLADDSRIFRLISFFPLNVFFVNFQHYSLSIKLAIALFNGRVVTTVLILFSIQLKIAAIFQINCLFSIVSPAARWMPFRVHNTCI